MDPNIIPIPLKVPCYLVRTSSGFILIDSGDPSDSTRLEKELVQASVTPENLQLVIFTHGDFDHTGNAVLLRRKFGAKLAMHASDSGMVEKGDMGFNRKLRSDRISVFGRIIMFISSHFVPSTQFDVFVPDILVKEGQDLNEFGFDARILELPGHSKGSIGVLTGNGDLFCGDLLMNMLRPDSHFMIDDDTDFNTSLEKLKKLEINTVYPGHGKPFAFKRYIQHHH